MERSMWEQEEKSLHADKQPGGSVRLAGADILLVEDDDVLRDLVLRNLQARGHRVAQAENAEGAIVHLRASCFDLVILDINLPDRTGWDVLRTAQHDNLLPLQRIDEQKQALPVVVLSAVRVSPARLAEFHPLAYLPKPFPMDALIRLAAAAAVRGNTRREKQEVESVQLESG
jgi:DNA-binding response OmpR family regulator